jgi:hypothetical protein
MGLFALEEAAGVIWNSMQGIACLAIEKISYLENIYYLALVFYNKTT